MKKVGKFIYLAASWLFVVGVVIQVFLAGMVVVARLSGWNNHINLGHTLSLPLLLMLIFQYVGRLPGRMKWFTWLLFVAYALQADVLIFLRFSAPLLSAFHPVLALVDIVLGWSLARQAWVQVKGPRAIEPSSSVSVSTPEVSPSEHRI